MFILAIVAVVAIGLVPSEALAWGPITHLYYGASFLEGVLPTVNPAVFALVNAWPLDFHYGSIAADIIVGKNATPYLYHCHNWLNAYRLFDHAPDDRTRAFLYGYMAHLAADVVAHNGYIPLRRIEAWEARVTGHTLWEVYFDHAVRGRDGGRAADLFHALDRGAMRGHDRFLKRYMFGTVIRSFGLNKRIFEGLMVLQKMKRWDRMTAFMGDVSRWPVDDAEVQHWTALTHRSMSDFFAHPEDNPLSERDPRGTLAFALAKEIRSEIEQLAQLRVLGAAAPREVRDLFAPFFEGIALGQPVPIPNLSQLFDLVTPRGSGRSGALTGLMGRIRRRQAEAPRARGRKTQE
jgi:pentatricopeptide repeat protein